MSHPIVRSLSNGGSVRVHADTPTLTRAAADEFVRSGADAIGRRGRFDIALSGGSTPRSVYSLLASTHAGSLSWDKVHLFFGDERPVGPEDPQSNYRMVRETLLSNPVMQPVIHRIEAERPAEEAADRYEGELRNHFGAPPPAQPQFDLVLLGLGTDGHTASLFPGTAALHEESRAVVANVVPQLQTKRITLTFPAINQGRRVIFLTAGADKAAVLAQVLSGTADGEAYPSQSVRPAGELLWMVDAAAAKEWLERASSHLS
ncbi:MAG TPA: 6-phosphogluconolactonase [Verrucomicrobiae bacterium]|nr:6-phosphogluconolactonase [Verrucomicrobiae bacterium]